MSDVKNKPNPQAKALIDSMGDAVVMLTWDADVGGGVLLPQVNFFRIAKDGGIELVDKKDATIMPHKNAVILAERSRVAAMGHDWWRGKNPLYEAVRV